MKNQDLTTIRGAQARKSMSIRALHAFLTAMLLTICLCAGRSLAAAAAQRDLNIVAHQYDDIIFMNPTSCTQSQRITRFLRFF
jgi:hypothetical protein